MRVFDGHLRGGLGAADPVTLFRCRTEGQGGFVQEDRRGGERIAAVFGRPAADREQLAAVVVAKLRPLTGFVADRAQVARLRARRLVEDRGGRIVRALCDSCREQIEVRGITVIVRRQLGVAAVGANLPRRFPDQNRAADRGAARAGLQLGKRAARRVERQRFARAGACWG